MPSVRKNEITVGCLFSGMGGFASGFVKAGCSIRWASDNDQYACEVFRYRLPGVPVIEKDVRNLSVQTDDLTSVDVVAAGFPCQSFSQAGNRLGFKDPRGKLFFEIPRLIGEFAPLQRPKLLVLENVPYLMHGSNKDWFDQVRRTLRRAGYWFREESCWTVNVKDATELPQDRERLFMVGASRQHFSHNPFTLPEIEVNTERRLSLDVLIDRSHKAPENAYLSSDNKYYKMIEKKINAGESVQNIYQLRRSYVREKKQGLCPTLTANMGIGGHNVPFVRDSWGIRKLSVREVALLQGFDSPDQTFPHIPVQEQYRLLGNTVCVNLAYLMGRKCTDILNGEFLDE